MPFKFTYIGLQSYDIDNYNTYILPMVIVNQLRSYDRVCELQ